MAPVPEVTIVIPTKDRWPLLRSALAAALGQADVQVEVVVVDDGSSDETPARLSAMDDARLRVLRNVPSAGVARARNRGIEAARGEWIAFLDDDDLWSPRKLRAQLDAARATGASFVYGTALVLDRSKRPTRALRAPDPATLRRRVLLTNPVGGPSALTARTELVRRVGGFDENLSALADWDLLIRLAIAAPGAACREVVIGYVQHGENMLVADDEAALAEFEYLARKHAPAARAAGVPFGALWLSRWIALGHRLAGRRVRAAWSLARGAVAARSSDNLLRAIGVLGGERVMRRGQRALAGEPIEPDWLARYR